MAHIEKDTAYFLHQIPYRDNSAIAHLLTREHGKVSFIVSGLKAKKHAKRPFLLPCRKLAIEYQLKNNLSKLVDIHFAPADKSDANEEGGMTQPPIEHFMLYQYANELLLTILPDQLPVPHVFDDYQRFLYLLTKNRPHAALRHIEVSLLIAFSGLPTLTHTEDTQEKVLAEQSYWFYPDKGLFSRQQDIHDRQGIAIDGAQALAFYYLSESYLNNQNQEPIDEMLAQSAKALTACLITPLLNGKKLKTRLVYQALSKRKMT